jgi:hypothetical protein
MSEGLTYIEIVRRVLSKVQYKDWTFEVMTVHGQKPEPWDMGGNSDLLLRVTFTAPDNVTGNMELQTGRKWLIEYGTHPTQVVQAAWLAVQRAEMHEIAEQFRYKGATIFNRHIDVDSLVDASKRMD